MLGLLRNRCLWRGVGVGSILSNPTNTYNYISSTSNHRYVLSSFLQVSHIGDYFTNKSLYAWEDIAKVESFSKEVEEPKRIAKGDIIDLHDLLFTKNRDYLVRYQDNQHVKAEHLAAKVIVIYFLSLRGYTDYIRRGISHLEDLYDELYPQNGFEVVFVAVKDVDHEHVFHRDCWNHFEQIFSLRPWIAIPLSDIPSLESLRRRGFREISKFSSTILVVDTAGMVLQFGDYHDNLEIYGALGYPFSDERINYLKSEEDAIAMQPSLQTLLASHQRDYLISNKGDKVPIHTLEDKVVALYFYEDGLSDDSHLKMAYEELKKNKENFEVVLIYFPYAKDTSNCRNIESFWKTFKTMPWLALPFKDPHYKKLKRILKYPSHTCDKLPSLLIFGPHGEFIEPFGADILKVFGVRGYPFTCAKIVKLETEKAKDMRLEMLWDQNTLFTGKDGSEVYFSQLSGKRVIVFLERYRLDSADIEFLKTLKKMYVQSKGTYDEFEVIHIIGGDTESSSASNYVGYLPWLVSLSTSELLPGGLCFFSVYGDNSFNSFVFFDQGGKVVRKTIWPSFESIDFPFCAYGLEEEAWVQLNVLFDWRSFYSGTYSSWKRSIYSLEKTKVPASLRVFKY
ncbi:hypothetical protein OROMI_023762 [Orobanche minor]